MASGFNINGVSIDSTYAQYDDIDLAGATLYAWGENSFGALGVGDNAQKLLPTQVSELTSWSSFVANDSASFAIKPNGTLWAWGYNGDGQLGLGDSTFRLTPTQIGAQTNWAHVSSSGSLSTAAIKTDGTLWMWGANYYGQLGLNDIALRSSPVQVGSLTNWRQASIGYNWTVAVKTDGTLWAWGHNLYGQLGLGDTVTRSSPVQVGSLTDWKYVSAKIAGVTVAIKTDGTLWTWGAGSSARGQGGSTFTARSSPTQIGSLTTWQSVSGGNAHCAAIRVDGTLWTWGANSDGRLGLGDTTDRSSPTQVGAQTNWAAVDSGDQYTVALKTDGTIWAWGNNSSGQLGIGVIGVAGFRSSPVQVGSLTNWASISAGASHVLALQADYLIP